MGLLVGGWLEGGRVVNPVYLLGSFALGIASLRGSVLQYYLKLPDYCFSSDL